MGRAPEEQSRRTQEQIVAEEVITTDEEVPVAVRQHGWMCTENGALTGLRKRRRQHGWTCPQPYGNAVVFSFE